MRTIRLTILSVAFGTVTFAQALVGLTDGFPGSRLNQDAVSRKIATHGTAAKSDPRVVVFTGDRVIAQFVDGARWQTAVTVINLENHPTSFDVLFFNDDGTDLVVPVAGDGFVRGEHISLNTA